MRVLIVEDDPGISSALLLALKGVGYAADVCDSLRDARIAGIVANWPAGATADRAARLGLAGDACFADIIRQYIADCRQRPDAGQTLAGLPA